MQDAITILSLLVAGISGLASILWSKQYRDAKQAELDAKDAEISAKDSELRSRLASKDEQIKTIEEKYRGIFETKDEQINFLKELTPHKLKEAYDSRKEMFEEHIDKLNSDITELQEANAKLNKQLEEAKVTISVFVTKFPQNNLDTSQQELFNQFDTFSGEILDNLSETADVYKNVEQKFISSTNEISEVAAQTIMLSTAEVITIADIAKVEISGPDSSEPDNEMEDDSDDPETPQPVEEI